MVKTYVVPGGMVHSGMRCRDCDGAPYCLCIDKDDAPDSISVTYPVCYEHMKARLKADNNRPFMPERGTDEAKASGEYAVSFDEANPDADSFELAVDCYRCGKTHPMKFTKVPDPSLVRSASGVFVTMTHQAYCTATGLSVPYGRAPREADF